VWVAPRVDRATAVYGTIHGAPSRASHLFTAHLGKRTHNSHAVITAAPRDLGISIINRHRPAYPLVLHVLKVQSRIDDFVIADPILIAAPSVSTSVIEMNVQ
jgi:hypothetical protein